MAEGAALITVRTASAGAGGGWATVAAAIISVPTTSAGAEAPREGAIISVRTTSAGAVCGRGVFGAASAGWISATSFASW